MLDDFGNELENTESKIDSTMKKMAKVLHMNNGNFKKAHCALHKFDRSVFILTATLFHLISDKRQWIAIGVLSLILFIVILLFIIL